MARLGALFIIVCMALISASVGAVLFLLAGVSSTTAALAALAVLTVLAAYHAVTARTRDRTDFSTQFVELSRGTADLAVQLAEVSRRAASLESKLDMAVAEAAEKAYAATKPIAAEVGDLGNLVKELAETVSVHELKLASAMEFVAGAEHEAAPPVQPRHAQDLQPESKPESPAPSDNEQTKAQLIETVREATAASRVDLYLQPIVTLPQRKVRYYETSTWLRAKDNTLLSPPEFIDIADADGLMPQIDNLMLFRAIQVIRRLQLKNRDTGLFCAMSVSTLNDIQIFPQILQFMDANRALGQSFMLQFRQKAFLGMGPLELEALAALRNLGFRFCIDGVTDLRLDPRDLGERGVRYVKVPAPLLLGQGGASRSDIHSADLSDLLGRFGISLIADGIDTEAQVIDLLEYDVRFGQGALFSPPRPVRADALRAADAPARDDADKTRDKSAAGKSSGIAL